VRRRVAAAVGAGLVFYALGDLLLWQRIFEARHPYQYDAAYQTGYREILLGIIAVGMLLLFIPTSCRRRPGCGSPSSRRRHFSVS
jgi:hypothetical protein